MKKNKREDNEGQERSKTTEEINNTNSSSIETKDWFFNASGSQEENQESN
jgi:hypothetical protein